jgi:two-component system sensor histidine kinase PilS (NtrC family)
MTAEFTAEEIKLTKSRWHSLKLYNAYRIFIALLLLISHGIIKNDHGIQIFNNDFFTTIAISYLAFSLFSAFFTWLEKPSFEITLPIQVIFDVFFIILLMHAESSSQHGIGLLLVITIAGASLISGGRLALFYAAVATIGILLEQSYNTLAGINSGSYTAAAILSLACFVIAWLAHSLAQRTEQSEMLASQRGLDLLNLAQVNALITHKMKDGVLVIDSNQTVKHHNLQAEALLNIESDDWENQSLNDLSPQLAMLMQQWIKQTEQSKENTISNFSKISVSSRDLGINFLPISDTISDGMVIFIEDWSQIQTQSHQVKLAALGRLTANIAHEIRNPLSAISHANQLLQEEENISTTNSRMLQIISDNVLRVDQIIKDVLELNRRDRTNQETIQLESFVTDFYNQFCSVEKIPQNKFTLSLANTENNILFDRRHINQILWNLCKNGWRHCKQLENSLKLTISATDKARTIMIEVSDDGDGIPDEVSSRLFEPFFTTEKTGTGLGLYIGRELADANGAKLQFKTSATGTRFFLLIKKT